MLQQRGQAEQLLSSIQRVSAAVGVAAYTSTFQAEANHHANKARAWLVFTAAFAMFGFAAIVWTISKYLIPSDATTAVIVQYAIVRVVLIGSLSYVTFWCSRNYRAHRHLQVVNKHRETALAMFQTFVGSTSDPSVRDAVLLEATRCIFAPSQTGYLGDESLPTDRMLDVAKTLTGK